MNSCTSEHKPFLPLSSNIRRKKGLLSFYECYVGVSLIALMFAPLNRGILGLLIGISAVMIAVKDPFAWFLFISGSQIVPDPALSPFTLAQMLMIGWLVTLPLNGCIAYLKYLYPMTSYIAPFACWFLAAFAMARGQLHIPMLLAFITGLVCFIYALRARDQLHRALFFLAIGGAFPVLGYWAWRLGLPVVATIYELALTSHMADQEVFRIGAGRADANTAGLNIPLLVIGVVGLMLFSRLMVSSTRLRKILLLGGVPLAALALPAIGATLSRGALYAMALSTFCLLVIWMFGPSRRTRRTSILLPVTACMVGIFVLAYEPARQQFGIDQAYSALQARNLETERTTQSDSFMAGRLSSWDTHFEIMKKYPLIGITKGEIWDFGEYGAGRVGIDAIGGAAHNVFLDFGSSSGIVGLVLFTCLFFRAPVILIRRRGFVFALPFLVELFPIFFGFMSLSAGNWKTYWGLLACMIAGIWALPATKASRINPAVRETRSYAARKFAKCLQEPPNG